MSKETECSRGGCWGGGGTLRGERLAQLCVCASLRALGSSFPASRSRKFATSASALEADAGSLWRVSTAPSLSANHQRTVCNDTCDNQHFSNRSFRLLGTLQRRTDHGCWGRAGGVQTRIPNGRSMSVRPLGRLRPLLTKKAVTAPWCPDGTSDGHSISA